MKKLIAITLCLILVLVPCFSVFTYADEETGSGEVAGYTLDTETKTFTVSTPAGLNAVRDLINNPDQNAELQSYNIVLDADLDFEAAFGGERNWTPIGYTSADQKTYYPFCGTFDGAGHTIKGLYTVSTAGGKRFQALIGVGIGCTIKNVTVADSTFEGLEFVAGILAVDDGGDVVIQNCHVLNCTINAAKSNGNNVGGIVGRFRGGQTATGIAGFKVNSVLIENCTVLANMDSFRNIGGICGGEAVGAADVWTATFRNCVAGGNYTYYNKASDGASGIFAYNAGNNADTEAASMTIIFENCVSVANITNAAEGGNNLIGSIMHMLRDGAYTMTNCIGMGAYSANFVGMRTAFHVLTVDNCAIYDPEATEAGTASFWVDAGTVTEPAEGTGTIKIDGEAATFKDATLPVITTQQLTERVIALYEDEAFQSRALNVIAASAGHEHVFDQQVAAPEYIYARATCQDKAIYYYSCTCGLKGTETFEYGEPTPHNFAEGWSMDENEHWHTCIDCLTEKSDVSEHTFGEWSVTREATERREGEQRRVCSICGYAQTEKIAKLEPATSAVEAGSDEETAPVTNAPETSNETKPAPVAGCQSVLTGGIVAIVAVVSVGCFTTRKKKED